MTDPERNALVARSDQALILAQSGFVERGLALANTLLAQIDRGRAPAQLATPPPIQFDWVTIPAGEFLMGSDKQKDPLAHENEMPQHRLYLPTYRISRTPITVAQFSAFVDATGYTTEAEEYDAVMLGIVRRSIETSNGSPLTAEGLRKLIEIHSMSSSSHSHWRRPTESSGSVAQRQEHPVTWVSWYDAQRFCSWASDVIGKALQLPSEAEWEKAARGVDGRIHPWGDQPPSDQLCNCSGMADILPAVKITEVGSYPVGASPYGVLDMVGNVSEWTRSLSGSGLRKSDYTYPYNAFDGREDHAAPSDIWRITRGGAVDWMNKSCRCARRCGRLPQPAAYDIGFRVVLIESYT